VVARVGARPGSGAGTRQGGSGSAERGFRNEIKLLSSLHHRNLVTLLGYCLHDASLLLVYEFVPRGSLEALLYPRSPAVHPNTTLETPKTNVYPPPLTWDQRLKIASGPAWGLDYLHSQVSPCVTPRREERQYFSDRGLRRQGGGLRSVSG